METEVTLTQREIELVRIGFTNGLRCGEIHPEIDDYDALYFNNAIEDAEELNALIQ